ncbi:MAG: DNA sulfur modification protein DndB [Lachnospiraceae bacterium]|jgi:DNA sulfur modification protein DndB|nr:DNA sulfur modification protein DndB [Lachnospiraceae bacterium]
MSVTMLALKGKMGENEYYITTMKASTLINTVGFASEMQKWPDMSVDERMQREIKGDRVISEIVPYIINDPEWFFGSLIVDIYSGWEAVEFQNIQEICTTNLAAYRDTLTSAGFLTLPDNKILIALDGQHRLCALSVAIRGANGIPGSVKVSESLKNSLEPHPEIGNADVTVIFIRHESDAKIRKIFNKVNRYAKQTSKGDNIITSEDDMLAVITRAMFSGTEDAPLRPINNQELVNWKSNTIPLRSKMLTTAAAIYTMAEVMLEPMDITPKTRRNEEKLEQGIRFMNDFWNRALTEVNAFKQYKQYVIDGNPLDKFRKQNLLLKPVTQMALAQAIRTAMDYGYQYKDLTSKINQINWNPEYYVWSNILVINSKNKKMITGSQALKDAGEIIAYMLIGDEFSNEKKEHLLLTIRQAQDDDEIELPPITR